jgi:multidrug efflux pump subunit AcrA (membrane-fusion protein)
VRKVTTPQIVTLAALIGAASCRSAPDLQEFVVASGAVAPKLRLEGSVAFDRIRVIRAPFAARLTDVAVEVGQRVEAGAVLGTLDTADAALDYRRKQAGAIRAKRRLRELPAGSDLSLERLEIEIAEAELERARGALASAAIRTPLQGTVVQLNGQAGDSLTPAGPPFAVIVDPSTAFLEIEGDQFDMRAITPGLPCVAEFDSALGSTVRPCRIMERPTLKRPAPGQGAGATLRVRARLEADTSSLQAGLAARVEVELARRSGVVTVPLNAVVRADGKNFVVARTQNGIRTMQVTTGLSDQWMVEITSGLSSNAVVLVGAPAVLRQAAGLSR